MHGPQGVSGLKQSNGFMFEKNEKDLHNFKFLLGFDPMNQL